MENIGLQSNQQRHVEQTRKQVLILLTKCISDIRKTVTASGLTLGDVGIGVEQHQTYGDSYIVDLKVRL
jgi:hypothetical protein